MNTPDGVKRVRNQRTKQELDAGLRKKISAFRKVVHLADELHEEIEDIIKEKDLNRLFVYHKTQAHREHPLI